MEKTFYEDTQICVTNIRVIVNGKDYPLQDIVSVEETIDEPRKVGWPCITLIAGIIGTVIGLCANASAWAFGCLVVALSAAFFLVLKTTSYTVTLVTTHGRVAIIDSQNAAFVRAVMRAINDALANRILPPHAG